VQVCTPAAAPARVRRQLAALGLPLKASGKVFPISLRTLKHGETISLLKC
jgi:hypothetical protein